MIWRRLALARIVEALADICGLSDADIGHLEGHA
jgi:hypothetical protein